MENYYDKHKSKPVAPVALFNRAVLGMPLRQVACLGAIPIARASCQAQTMAAGSFLVKMGISTQPAKIFLKPHGA